MTTPVRPSLVSPHIAALPKVAHGSDAAAELARYGLDPADVLDFSVNTNPLGPAPNVLEAIESAEWTRYPGDDEGPLRQGLARANGVDPDQVVIGNGSSELLWLIALAVLRQGDRAVVCGPTFGEYARAAHVVGARVTESSDLVVVSDARMVFLCNPNNPTGRYLSQSAVETLLHSGTEAVVVLDEAYASFVATRWPSAPLLSANPNLVILRSLTKDHALPGLRLGYLLASEELAHAIESVRPPWSVNAGALRAGLTMLEPAAYAHVSTARSMVAASRKLLTDGLAALGYAVMPSEANFVLVNVGDATSFRQALISDAMVVRDCTSFGLPAHVRIVCKRPEECQRLLDAIHRLRSSGALPIQ